MLSLSAYDNHIAFGLSSQGHPLRINSLRDLIAAVHGRRLELGLSQSEVAERTRVSRQWIGAFEAGKPTAEIGLVIRLLDALGLRLEIDAPEGQSDRMKDRSIDLDALLDEYREG